MRRGDHRLYQAFPQKQPLQLPKRNPSASACEPFRETIELGLSRGRNAMAIWQDLVTDDGFSGGYQTVKRFVRKLRGRRGRKRRHHPHRRRRRSQVDYGTGPMVRDPQTGKYRRTRLFVMTLGYSRKAVRLLVFRSSAARGPSCMRERFADLGGMPPRGSR